jgi:hypothetical protein
MPVKELGAWSGFSHYDPPGNDFYRVAVGYRRQDVESPEASLGYPACCQRWFAEVFPSILDPVWQWAWSGLANTEFEREESSISLQPSPYLNPMLRYASIRFSPHIPCSTDCKDSTELAKKMRGLMNPETAGWIEQLLSEPIEWSCYRGIAIITTKQFRIIVGSNPTKLNYIVRSSTPTLTKLAPYVKAKSNSSIA